MLLLIVIAVNRYVAITHPVQYKRWFSPRNAVILMSVCLVLALSYSIVGFYIVLTRKKRFFVAALPPAMHGRSESTLAGLSLRPGQVWTVPQCALHRNLLLFGADSRRYKFMHVRKDAPDERQVRQSIQHTHFTNSRLV